MVGGVGWGEPGGMVCMAKLDLEEDLVGLDFAVLKEIPSGGMGGIAGLSQDMDIRSPRYESYSVTGVGGWPFMSVDIDV